MRAIEPAAQDLAHPAEFRCLVEHYVRAGREARVAVLLRVGEIAQDDHVETRALRLHRRQYVEPGTADELQVEEHHVGGDGERAVDRAAHRLGLADDDDARHRPHDRDEALPDFRSILDHEHVHLVIRYQSTARVCPWGDGATIGGG